MAAAKTAAAPIAALLMVALKTPSHFVVSRQRRKTRAAENLFTIGRPLNDRADPRKSKVKWPAVTSVGVRDHPES
jgi:hypothetical protein